MFTEPSHLRFRLYGGRTQRSHSRRNRHHALDIPAARCRLLGAEKYLHASRPSAIALALYNPRQKKRLFLGWFVIWRAAPTILLRCRRHQKLISFTLLGISEDKITNNIKSVVYSRTSILLCFNRYSEGGLDWYLSVLYFKKYYALLWLDRAKKERWPNY